MAKKSKVSPVVITEGERNETMNIETKVKRSTRERTGLSTEQFIEANLACDSIEALQKYCLEKFGKVIHPDTLKAKRGQLNATLKEAGYEPLARFKGSGAPKRDIAGLAAKFNLKKVSE